MKHTILAAALALTAGAAVAAPEKYVLDPSHSQIVFSYNHLGYSTTYGMFSGFEGEIMFDQADPAGSSVTVSFPVRTMMTGWEERFAHFMTDDFFGADEGDIVSFRSTGIEVTGESTAKITGDLFMNGMTKSVVLNASLNQAMAHPMKEGQPWAGFDAETTILRSDFGVDKFAPYVGDKVKVMISIEAGKAQ